MKPKKITETEKKLNKEIIKRMKKVANVEKDIDLTINSDITKANINAFKCLGIRSFYKIIVEFGIKHNASVNWLVSGSGEMFIQTPQDTAITPEERDLTGKLLAVLRHGPDEEMKTVFRNLVNTYYTAYARAAGNSADKPDTKGGGRPK